MTVDTHHFIAFVRSRLADHALDDAPNEYLDAIVDEYLNQVEAHQ
jgi:hypothetical protein